VQTVTYMHFITKMLLRVVEQGWSFSIRFGLVFIYKKNNQTKNFIFWNWTETGSNRPVSVRFLGQKPAQTGLARFFRFDSVFSVLARFFPVWLGFFSDFNFGLGSIRFGFFGFLLIKLKLNRTGRFFQNFNRFFSRFGFFGYFFSGFLSLISFLVFLLTSTVKGSTFHYKLIFYIFLIILMYRCKK
jgi:hypothetical protein